MQRVNMFDPTGNILLFRFLRRECGGKVDFMTYFSTNYSVKHWGLSLQKLKKEMNLSNLIRFGQKNQTSRD